MFAVVVHRLVCQPEGPVAAQRPPGVGVDVEPREVAAADIKPDGVAGLEDVGGWVQVELDAADLAFPDRFGPGPVRGGSEGAGWSR